MPGHTPHAFPLIVADGRQWKDGGAILTALRRLVSTLGRNHPHAELSGLNQLRARAEFLSIEQSNLRSLPRRPSPVEPAVTWKATPHPHSHAGHRGRLAQCAEAPSIALYYDFVQELN